MIWHYAEVESFYDKFMPKSNNQLRSHRSHHPYRRVHDDDGPQSYTNVSGCVWDDSDHFGMCFQHSTHDIFKMWCWVSFLVKYVHMRIALLKDECIAVVLSSWSIYECTWARKCLFTRVKCWKCQEPFCSTKNSDDCSPLYRNCDPHMRIENERSSYEDRQKGMLAP